MHQDTAPARQPGQEDHFVERVDERMQLALAQDRPADQSLTFAPAVLPIELHGQVWLPAEDGGSKGQKTLLADFLQTPDRPGIEQGLTGLPPRRPA